MVPSNKAEYRIPAKCHVCGQMFMARYNVAARARVCTPSDHRCRPGKGLPCLRRCCRSKYYVNVPPDSAIDPRFVLSKGEFSGMWKASRKLDDPEGVTIRFIARTGCRLQEAFLVTSSSIKWSKGPVSIISIPTIKHAGEPVRQVHLRNDDAYSDELRRWAKQASQSGPLFRVARRTLQRALEGILEPIKPDRASLVHILRHTRASQLIRAGANWDYVRQQLGWSRLETAKRYAHTDAAEIAAVLGKI